jgi:hypothetical protein
VNRPAVVVGYTVYRRKKKFPTLAFISSLSFPISTEQADWETKRNALAARMAQFDPVYKQLADEKLAGWQSEAVSALWKSRTRKFKIQSSGNRTEDSKKFTPEDTKYFKFYSDVLNQFVPGIFVNTGNDETFIDIGSAPGGLSRFLNTVCNWRGYAFSLSPAEGGLQMKYSNPRRLHFSMANMTKENEWKRVVDLAKQVGMDEVNFVNMGVVVDFGQVESDNGDSSTMACRSIHASVSQFLIMLNTLKDGGSAMWIHSLSHLDSFFFFMEFLVELFETVRIINTLSPARSPVYVIMSGYRKRSPKVQEFNNLLYRGGSVVTPATINKWQIDDFGVIERVMTSFPIIRSDIQTIWNQKRQCLEESRLYAERRFGSSKEGSVSGPPSEPSKSPPAEIDESRRTATRPTAAVVCSVSPAELVEDAATTLLTVPQTFRPQTRKKPEQRDEK